MARNSSQTETPGGLSGLRQEASGLVSAVVDRTLSSAMDKVEGATGRLGEFAENGGPGLKAAATGAKDLADGKGPVRSYLGAGWAGLREKAKNMVKGKGKGGEKIKVTNIVESIDVGAPVSVVYEEWTKFSEFPGFMKKVERVDETDEGKLKWRAQILWSHREWESTTVLQEAEDKIVWRSKGAKGYVDGAVTFHALAPNLTRVLVSLEYHPQGFFEHTGNLWRAQGRRARLELKHFRRHVMSQVLAEGAEGQDGQKGQKGQHEDQEGQDRKPRERKAQQAPRGERAKGNGGARRKPSANGNGRQRRTTSRAGASGGGDRS